MHASKFMAALTAVILLVPGRRADARKINIEENEPPQITHFPPVVAYRGQPIPVYAKVVDETGKIKKVSLFYALSQQLAPIEVPMKKTGDKKYSGLIPANFFARMSKVWYFIEARDSFDDKGETTWFPVLIKDPDTEKKQPDNAAATEAVANGNTVARSTAPATGAAGPTGTAVPAGATLTTATGGGMGTTALVGIGILGAGGAAVALSGGGGGGGDDGGGGSGFDPNNAVVVNASGSASGGFSSGPQDKTIDGTSQVAGRTVTGVRVTVNFQAYTLPDQFQILYEGNVIADSGSVSDAGTIQGTAGGSTPSAVVRVITNSGDTSWDWSATLEISTK